MGDNDTSRVNRKWIIAGGSCVLAVFVGVAWWSWASLMATDISRAMVAGIPLWKALGLVAVEAGLLVLAYIIYRNDPTRVRSSYRYGRNGGWQDDEPKAQKSLWRPVVWIGSVVLVVLTIPLWYFAIAKPWNRWEHDARHAEITSTLKVVDGEAPGFTPRVAYPVAQAQLERGLGAIRGELVNVRYIPQQKNWCGLVVINDSSDWRRPLQAVACVNEHNKVTVKRFAAKTPSPDAKFYWNLKRRVTNLARGTVFGDKDEYGYIDTSGKPIMVVPVKAFKSAGGGKYYDAPQGVVVYNSKHPKGHYFRNVKAGQFDGPVIGISVAEDLRAALNDRLGYKASFQHRGAYETTSLTGGARDVLDPNAGNTSEFLLGTGKGNGVAFVTPLTPYGRSTTITAVLVVKGGSIKAGEMPETVLYKLKTPRRSLADAAVTIAQRYGSNIPFASDNGSSANQVRILEITPGTGPDRWIASIGRAPVVSWRVEIGRDLSTRIFDASGHERRYDKGDDPTPIPVGSLIGIGNEVTPHVSDTPSDNSESTTGDIQTTPIDQLIAERNRIQAEIDRRAAAAK